MFIRCVIESVRSIGAYPAVHVSAGLSDVSNFTCRLISANWPTRLVGGWR